MPRPEKGLTSRNTLRLTARERDIVDRERARYAENGVTLSLNDTIRAMIRKAGRPYFPDQATARQVLEHHLDTCPLCSPDGPRCVYGVDILGAANGHIGDSSTVK